MLVARTLLRILQFALEFSCQFFAFLIIGIYFARSIVPLFVFIGFEIIIYPLLQYNLTYLLFLKDDRKQSQSKFRIQLIVIVVCKTLVLVPLCLYTLERIAEYISLNHEWKETIELDADYEMWSTLFDNLKCTILMCVLVAMGALRKGLLNAFCSLIETNIDKAPTKTPSTSIFESLGYALGTLTSWVIYNKVAYEWYTEKSSFYYTSLYMVVIIIPIALLELIVAIIVQKVPPSDKISTAEQEKKVQKKIISFEEALIYQLKQDFLQSKFVTVLRNWAELLSSLRIFENYALMLVYLINMHFDFTTIALYLVLQAVQLFFARSPNSNYYFYIKDRNYWLLIQPYARFRGDNHVLLDNTNTSSQNSGIGGYKFLFILWKLIHTVFVIAATLLISQSFIFEKRLEVVQEDHYQIFRIFFILYSIAQVFDQLASRIQLKPKEKLDLDNDISPITRQWVPIAAQFLLLGLLIILPERSDPGLFNFKWCVDISCVLTIISTAMYTLYALI